MQQKYHVCGSIAGWGQQSTYAMTSLHASSLHHLVEHQPVWYWWHAAMQHCSTVWQHTQQEGGGEGQPDWQLCFMLSMDTVSSAKSFTLLSSTPSCVVPWQHVAMQHWSALWQESWLLCKGGHQEPEWQHHCTLLMDATSFVLLSGKSNQPVQCCSGMLQHSVCLQALGTSKWNIGELQVKKCWQHHQQFFQCSLSVTEQQTGKEATKAGTMATCGRCFCTNCYFFCW